MPSDDSATHPLGYYRGVLGSSIEPEAPALPGACFYSLCIGGAPNRPHTGGAGDLRESDSVATSQSGDRHGLRCICRLHRTASPRWQTAGCSEACGTHPDFGTFVSSTISMRCVFNIWS